jgi:integrase/recombinase XerD
MQKQHMIRGWIDGFLRDCRVRELSPFTISFYRAGLAGFEAYCRAQDVTTVQAITADLIRSWLLELEATKHNPGGRHAKYRAVRAWLNWYQQEAEPEDWNNPMAKVRPPKVAQEPIEPVSIATIRALLATCRENFTGYRDKAILLCLLDTGARVSEFVALNINDVDLIGGGVLIRKGKGNKPRVVFIGKKSRRALRAYLKHRTDEGPAAWVTSRGDRLVAHSLQGMLIRRAQSAGVDPPSPHDFRRAFALQCLRAGVDVFSLQRLMGHTTLDVLRKYLSQTTEDLQRAFERGSPADKM